jgi:hypothetical protein
MQALKRIGRPDDVADVIAFLVVGWCALDHRSELPGGRRIEPERAKGMVLPTVLEVFNTLS